MRTRKEALREVYTTDMIIIIAALCILLMVACFMVNKLMIINEGLRKLVFSERNAKLEALFDNNELKTRSKLGIITLDANQFCYPVDDPVFTSPLGMRKSPFTGKDEVHYGTDLYSLNMQVYAVRDGVVVEHYPAPVYRQWNGHPLFGGLIEIKDTYGLSRYAHLAETDVHIGDVVEAGQPIGIIGDSGLAKGKHLHFVYFLDIFQYIKHRGE